MNTAERFPFKPEFHPWMGWGSYGTIIVVLLFLILLCAKKNKSRELKTTACQLLDKKYLSAKTVVYVVEYQQQRFLLADNQQSLAIHRLNQEDDDV